LEFARLYGPAVVFAEDIDRVAGGERTEALDQILNTLDGASGKHEKIITVLTTNHLERINQAMLRPGRLDAVIDITPPDALACEKLARNYSRGLIPESADIMEACEYMQGRIPAFIREVVERSKLYAIANSPLNGFNEIVINNNSLLDAAKGMDAHFALLEGKKKDQPTDEQIFADAFRRVLLGSEDSPQEGSSNVVRTLREMSNKSEGQILATNLLSKKIDKVLRR
jgi:transitional endoplasmic reticulum ATPase